MKRLLIRFDDICPTMDWKQWNRADVILKEYDIKPLLGVIPFCEDPDLALDTEKEDFWQWLRDKQAKGYAIAMHGYNHVFCSQHRGILTYRIGSEFAGLPYDIQHEKIYKGKEILKSHGIDTNIFFAPGHSYDENTIKALAACGFKYVSDGKSNKAYTWHGVKFLPCRNSGGGFRSSEAYSTSIYHAHEWSKEGNKAYYFLKELIMNKHHEMVDFDEYKKQEEGLFSYQRVVEKIYVFLQFRIMPTLRKFVGR